MLDEFVGPAIISISLVEDVLADLLERLGYVQVEFKKFLHNLLVYLAAFGVHLLFGDEV